MFTAMIVSALLSAPAHAQSETPAMKGGTPPIESPNNAGKPPGIMPMPPASGDTKIKGDECKAEAKTASCKGDAIDMALLQCMMKYKKEHKGFSISQGCREAIRNWHMSQKGGH